MIEAKKDESELCERIEMKQKTGFDLPGLGDDIPCSKCGAALDTGLECTECGHDMMLEIYPEELLQDSVPGTGTVH